MIKKINVGVILTMNAQKEFMKNIMLKISKMI